jgi:hypothetical protein
VLACFDHQWPNLIFAVAKLIDHAPQRMQARETEAKIMEMMPPRVWLSCTAVARPIGAPDDRKTRARLDRLVSDCKIERKREQGTHWRGPGGTAPHRLKCAQNFAHYWILGAGHFIRLVLRKPCNPVWFLRTDD